MLASEPFSPLLHVPLFPSPAKKEMQNSIHGISLPSTFTTYTIVVCQQYEQVACSPLNKHSAPLTFI